MLEHPAFAGFGRLLLPGDDRRYDHAMPLRSIGSLLPYHEHVDPVVVVSALNRMVDDASLGRPIFYDIYTNAQRQAEPSRKDTGLFFFRGKPGAPFAIIAPGGGFEYVASLHEGFPYAVEISRRGFNAFVVTERPNPASKERLKTGHSGWRAEYLWILRFVQVRLESGSGGAFRRRKPVGGVPRLSFEGRP